MHIPTHYNRVLAITTALWLGAASAYAEPPETVQYSDQVAYMSGGIGSDEARAMERRGAQWPLMLLFTENTKPHAEFAADLHVTITNHRGDTVLDAASVGPYLLAKLPPGSYKVEARYGGQTLHRNVVVRAHHHTRASFVWPAGVGTDRV